MIQFIFKKKFQQILIRFKIQSVYVKLDLNLHCVTHKRFFSQLPFHVFFNFGERKKCFGCIVQYVDSKHNVAMQFLSSIAVWHIDSRILSRQNNYLMLFVKIISSHLPTNAIQAIFYICYCSCIGITSNMTWTCTNHVDNQFQIETTFSKLSYKILIESVDLGTWIHWFIIDSLYLIPFFIPPENICLLWVDSYNQYRWEPIVTCWCYQVGPVSRGNYWHMAVVCPTNIPLMSRESYLCSLMSAWGFNLDILIHDFFFSPSK